MSFLQGALTRQRPTTCGLDSVDGAKEMCAVDVASQGIYSSVEKKRQSHIKCLCV